MLHCSDMKYQILPCKAFFLAPKTEISCDNKKKFDLFQHVLFGNENKKVTNITSFETIFVF